MIYTEIRFLAERTLFRRSALCHVAAQRRHLHSPSNPRNMTKGWQFATPLHCRVNYFLLVVVFARVAARRTVGLLRSSAELIWAHHHGHGSVSNDYLGIFGLRKGQPGFYGFVLEDARSKALADDSYE